MDCGYALMCATHRVADDAIDGAKNALPTSPPISVPTALPTLPPFSAIRVSGLVGTRTSGPVGKKTCDDLECWRITLGGIDVEDRYVNGQVFKGWKVLRSPEPLAEVLLILMGCALFWKLLQTPRHALQCPFRLDVASDYASDYASDNAGISEWQH